MHPACRLLPYGALLCLGSLPALASASVVQRCEDISGHITFTTLGCPEGQSSETRRVFSPPPGSVAPVAGSGPVAPSEWPLLEKEIVIVGQRDDGCGNRLSAEARRRAIINGRVVPGMSIQEVENLLGRPAKIQHRNGELRYHYEDKKKKLTHQVTFDGQGCVRGKP
jgi:hypothetical protein